MKEALIFIGLAAVYVIGGFSYDHTVAQPKLEKLQAELDSARQEVASLTESLATSRGFNDALVATNEVCLKHAQKCIDVLQTLHPEVKP